MFGSRSRAVPALRPQDDGFSLVEAIVATAVLGVLMASSGLFFLSGLRGMAELQRRQMATSIAAQAMELATSVSAQQDSSGCVPLLYGRAQTAVTTQWAAPSSGVDLSDMDAAWNPTTCPGTVAVPLAGLTTSVTDDGTTPAVTRSGVGYTVRTYIGTCRKPPDGTSCVKPTAADTTSPQLFRIVVVVGWRGTACPASACRYTVGTLLSSTPDPLFNLRSEVVPTAGADTVCTSVSTAVLTSLLTNDSGPLGPSPVTIVSAPAHGSLAEDIATGIGSYTPVVGYTGLDSFTYRLTGSNGAQSQTATVTLKVGIAC